MKGGQAPGGRSEHGQRRKAAHGTAAGDEPHTGMMILASAMRHSVGRPATGMGGGTKNPMERLCQPPSEAAFVFYREQPNTAPPNGAKIVEEIRLTVSNAIKLTNKFQKKEKSLDKGKKMCGKALKTRLIFRGRAHEIHS